MYGDGGRIDGKENISTSCYANLRRKRMQITNTDDVANINVGLLGLAYDNDVAKVCRCR